MPALDERLLEQEAERDQAEVGDQGRDDEHDQVAGRQESAQRGGPRGVPRFDYGRCHRRAARAGDYYRSPAGSPTGSV